MKAGRSVAGARAAASHTGALAASDAIVDVLFHQAGVIRTTTIEELFDVAMLLAHQSTPRGRRVGILTNAGGPGILAADACEAHGLLLPALSEHSVARLRSLLPGTAATGNPVDMLASASAAHYEAALATMLEDDQLDSVLVIFIPPLVTKDTDVAQAVQAAARAHPGKTVAGIFMSAKGAPPALAPIPCFRFPESAAVALARAAERGEWLLKPDGTLPAFDDIDGAAARAVLTGARTRGSGWLTMPEVEGLLTAVRIPVARSETAATETDVVAAANRVGYPIVLKAIGPDILHKSDVGGVIVGLPSAAAVAKAWRELSARLGDRMSSALVQEMVTSGVDMLIGATDDPRFGPVIACATGGTLTELIHDATFRLHPLTIEDAAELIDGLKSARLLRGYRGGPVLDEAALRECLLRLSVLLELCPEIRELDINPVRVLPRGTRALDARVRVQF